MSGFEWYAKINQLVEKNQFSDDVIELLSQGPYQKKPELDDEIVNEIINQTQRWGSALSKEKASV